MEPLSAEEAESIRHENRMKELEYARESDRLKSNIVYDLEKQKYEWKLEVNRIFFEEQGKIIRMKSEEFKKSRS